MIPSQKTEAMCCAQVFGGENGDADGNLLPFYAGISHFLRGSFFIPARKKGIFRNNFSPVERLSVYMIWIINGI